MNSEKDALIASLEQADLNSKCELKEAILKVSRLQILVIEEEQKTAINDYHHWLAFNLSKRITDAVFETKQADPRTDFSDNFF